MIWKWLILRKFGGGFKKNFFVTNYECQKLINFLVMSSENLDIMRSIQTFWYSTLLAGCLKQCADMNKVVFVNQELHHNWCKETAGYVIYSVAAPHYSSLPILLLWYAELDPKCKSSKSFLFINIFSNFIISAIKDDFPLNVVSIGCEMGCWWY